MGEGETEPMEVENAPTPGGSTKCGAKTRRGKPCESPAVRGKRRCRMHGGAPGITAASRNTRFQAAGYGLTWAGLAPADRASLAWRLPSLNHLVGEREQLVRNIQAESLCG